ncbi:peroxide stress protein YaaA [Streptococcus panodentis]|uniref:UPF0246 protein DHL47_12880 n=1 Tax=Streptococcus panodentis TaxID=1581472 RepID=A0ABS5B050_9STRE|nr:MULTISPECIES: peroxide stress protein YaaA [Streptococcus]KXT83807.1 UPF0246 protein YaaA [Streptococcus sp. DD11]MBP2622197.1 peroxide stress protein YaaA [Streptococcus panodentis]
MKILIPTAKELNLSAEPAAAKPLSQQTQTILDQLAAFSAADLAQFYKISPERAALEFVAIQALREGKAQHAPALYLFDGLMYRHIKREGYSAAERQYIQKHLAITSALYGILPALEPIAPHRLDFMMPLKPDGKSLKTFWKTAYDQALAEEEAVFSLLSSEFETVFSKAVRQRMICFKFLEDRAGQLKVHSTISKKARGDFLTALIENQVTEAEQMKTLNFAGFAYRPDLSSEQELVYVKEG